MHIKEEPADNDDDDDDDAVNVRTDDDETSSSDRYLSSCKINFEEDINPETLPSDMKPGIYACSQSHTQKTDGEGLGLSEAGCPQEEFQVGEEKANSAGNPPQEFGSDIDESTSSTFTVSDVLEADTESKKNGPESVPVQTHSTRPKRKRKKKELKDMLSLTPVKRRKWKTKTYPTSTQEYKKSKSDKRSAKNTKGAVPVGSAHIYCGQCGRIFVNSQKFQQHETQCLKLEAPVSHAGYYPCHKCQKVFQHVAAQQLHMLRDHPDISHTCPFCGKVFAYQSVMKKHLYTHTNEAVKKAITALKEDSTASTAGQESVLVNLISDLGVEGDTESNSLENKVGGLEMSVPLNNPKKGLAVLRSLPEVLGPSGLTKDETAPPLHLTVKVEGRSQSPRIDNMEDSCPAQVSEAADGSFHVVEDALGHSESSQSSQTVPTSSSVTCPSSSSSSSSVIFSTPVTPSSSNSLPAKTYLCKKCDSIFPGLPLLYKHEMESHLAFICRYCSKGFVYENMLRKHLAIHREADKHVCMWCGKKFSYITGLKTHALTHNGRLENHKLMCSKCGKCWYDTEGYLPQASKQLIGEHLQECFKNKDDLPVTYTKFGGKDTLQRCLECDKIYNLNNEHSRNMKMTHVFRCKVCHFEFKKLSDLKNHVFGHHDEAKELVKDYKEDQMFNCRLCSEHFSYLFEFMCHMADHKKETLEDRNV
ncbi:zinc finger protein 629-like [Haliotis rubra]|uniref:zinc finger protein 629-like n=1 Tax=Haliotis rubra TaxID=36100 RepID=UPI001EE534E8|nr:zinc finger protein 629-like [Haliotis rubra]